MGGYVQGARSPAKAAPTQAPRVPVTASGPVAQMMNRSPRVRTLTAQRAQLNNGTAGTIQRVADPAAPIQLGKKSRAQKNAEAKAGKAKAKEKKLNKVVKSVQGYNTGNKKTSAKDIRAAAYDLRAQGVKLQTGHLSADSSKKMNQGTKNTSAKVFAQVNANKKKKK